MITILTIILTLGVLIFVIQKLTKKKNTEAILEIFNVKLQNRLFKYLLFIVCSFILPFIVTIISIMISDSREDGMRFGYRLPFYIINFGFAFIIIKSRLSVKLISGLVVTIISLGFLWFIMESGVLKNEIFGNSDSYGIWRLLISFNIISLGSWEIVYIIINRLKLRNDNSTLLQAQLDNKKDNNK